MTTPPDGSADLLLALNAAPDLSRAAICRLALAVELWWPRPAAGPTALCRELAVPSRALERAYRQAASVDEHARREREGAGARGIRIVTLADPGYPAALRALDLPPPVLYVRGALPDAPALAVVGSRRATRYGLEAAAFFAEHVAAAGVTVVSGFARGVDAAAHEAALRPPGGRTVAVLGCGIDVPYPSRQEDLAVAIAERGAVLSELPLGTAPRPTHFPIRNRIIAALAAATLVVEAAPRSGSLITARLALELGRDVFAVPGRIFEETALGTNALLRDGAFAALHPGDVVSRVAPGAAAPTEEATPPLPKASAAVWAALPPAGSRGLDELAATVGEPMDRLLGLLLELELGGWVERLPGPAYARRRAW